jgi:L-ribulose-5-phosphate 3-epimerase
LIPKSFKQIKLGVMQGRLLPKYKGRYQAHPFGYWQDEFPIASELGLDCIEFIFDYDSFEENPLMTREGRSEIEEMTQCTGVEVRSICADFFMDCPMHSKDKSQADFSIEILRRLIDACSKLGIKDVVIPCVDQSSIYEDERTKRVLSAIQSVIPLSENLDVRLCLETDLPPGRFFRLLKELDSDSVSVNYDTGNSVSLGYDFNEELAAYGNSITDLHIKDRIYGGGSVPLGEGGMNFEEFFSCFSKINFEGIMILQAYRDDEGLKIFTRQLEFLRETLSNHY